MTTYASMIDQDLYSEMQLQFILSGEISTWNICVLVAEMKKISSGNPFIRMLLTFQSLYHLSDSNIFELYSVTFLRISIMLFQCIKNKMKPVSCFRANMAPCLQNRQIPEVES